MSVNERLSPAREQEIRERCNEATPGPWEATCRDVRGGLDSNDRSGLGWEVDGPPEPQLRGQFGRGQDALFVAHSRQDVPALLAELNAVRGDLATANERVRALETALRECHPHDWLLLNSVDGKCAYCTLLAQGSGGAGGY